MLPSELIDRFENRSRTLIVQAWIFLALVLVLLFAGALAVLYAQNLTASDIGAYDERATAVRKTRDEAIADLKAIGDGPARDCVAGFRNALGKWIGPHLPSVPAMDFFRPDVLSGDTLIRELDAQLARNPGGIRLTVSLEQCASVETPNQVLDVSRQDLLDIRTAVAGKMFVPPNAAELLKKRVEIISKLRSLETIANQIDVEKVEAQVRIQNKQASQRESDLFISLLQTSISRFGLLAVIGFFVSILVSLYRYNVRLAAFYIARADALRIAPEITISDFTLLASALSPAVEFGKTPPSPVGQLVDLIKSAKEVAK